MYDQVVKCQRAGLCLSEHFLIDFVTDNHLLWKYFLCRFISLYYSTTSQHSLHCTLAEVHYIVIGPVCLWVGLLP